MISLNSFKYFSRLQSVNVENQTSLLQVERRARKTKDSEKQSSKLSDSSVKKPKPIWYYENKEKQNNKLSDNGVKKQKPIWYYENKGIRMRKIQQVLRKDEDSLKDDNDDSRRMNGIVKFLRIKGISDKDIASMLFSKPRILELSKNKVAHRFQALNKLDFVEDELMKLVVRCPGVLLVDMAAELKGKMDAIAKLQCHPMLDSQKVKYIIHKCPDILLIRDTSTLAQKVDQMYALGFNEQQVYELLIKHPKFLTYSQETFHKKVDFIVDTLNGRLQLLVKFPRVLTCSLLRLQERHAFLMKEGYMKPTTRLSENKLRSMVLTTDKDFVYRVTNTKMKEYRQFQRDFRSGAVQEIEYPVADYGYDGGEEENFDGYEVEDYSEEEEEDYIENDFLEEFNIHTNIDK